MLQNLEGRGHGNLLRTGDAVQQAYRLNKPRWGGPLASVSRNFLYSSVGNTSSMIPSSRGSVQQGMQLLCSQKHQSSRHPFSAARRHQRRDVVVQAVSQASDTGAELEPPSQPASDWGPSPETAFASICVAACLCLLVAQLFYESYESLFLVSMAMLFGALFGAMGWSCLQENARAARFQQRDSRLPPDWHNLLDTKANRTFYYNSVTKTSQWELPGLLPEQISSPSSLPTGGLVASYLVRGLLQIFAVVFRALMTAGVYTGVGVTCFYCIFGLIRGFQLKEQLGTLSIFLGACFLALPQPLPPVILALFASGIPLSSAYTRFFESSLSLALLSGLIPEVLSFSRALARAARARIPALDFKIQPLDLLCALCPALSWRVWPSALQLNFDRVSLLPLPYGVPFQVPDPRWELLGRSWTALLYAVPMVLPLTRIVNEPTATSADFGKFLAPVLQSRPVQISVFVSVVTFLLRKQRALYVAALEERTKAVRLGRGESTVLEDLDKKILDDFDQRLGGE
jgi:hypothetical protein